MPKDRTRWPIVLGAAAWACAICVGFAVLWTYGNTAGAAAAAPQSWPTESRLSRGGNLPTLLLVAHPRCPCSRASLTELSILMTRCEGKLAATVLFVKPEGFEEGWEHADLWQEATRIPGVAVVSDEGGVEAARFGAFTSGQALLYGSKGSLLFSGGITSARGHEGDNNGVNTIQSLVASASADTDQRPESTTPVFGCPLQDPSSKCQVEVKDASDSGQ